ncbi:MAG: HK97-gp10 family putative phage morphogenesis protein [Nitrososphaerales archaeon]
MSEVEISVKGLQEANAAFQKVVDMHYQDVVKMLQTVGEKAAGAAQSNAPVRTGFLQASIQMIQTDDGCYVTAGAGYAGFVEFGTRKMSAQPFLRPAIEEAIQEIEELAS